MSSDTGRRRDLLNALVAFDIPPEEVLADLRRFPWDSEQELVEVSGSDLANVLDRFLAGGLDATAVEDWANAIEVRDDVGFSSAALKESVHRLANPTLEGELTPTEAKRLRTRFGS